MPLEKDFSPTLAGSDHAGVQTKILEWLRTIPDLIQSVSLCSNQNKRIQLGLKLFNALFDDDFQLEMLRTIHETRPEFFVYGNRLFDPIHSFALQ